MKITKTFAALCLILAAALPAMAQTAGQAQSTGGTLSAGVLWVAGVAAFLGFIIGSVPFHKEDYGWKFDMQGALMWAFAGAGIFGGLALRVSTGQWVPAVFGIGLGLLIALGRIGLTRPPRVPRKGDLADGINRGEGDSPSAKWRSAKSMYKHASFRNNNYYATRAPIEWNFGKSGISGEALRALLDSTANPDPSMFDILLLLVRELPGEPGQPAVIVVRGGSNLRQIKPDAYGLNVPGCDGKIPTASIAATVGYAWR